MSAHADEQAPRSRLNFILNIVGIVVSIKMLVLSIFVYTWDESAPPMHIAPDMDFMPRFRAQQPSTLFADGRGMRIPPAGTVAYGNLQEDRAFYEGVQGDGDPSVMAADPQHAEWVTSVPATVDREFMERGRERFEIFCAPCHGRTGDGVSEVARFMNPKPKNLHGEYRGGQNRDYKAYSDGYLYHVVSQGYATMKGYSDQMSAADRWAVVAYLRALQESTTVEGGR